MKENLKDLTKKKSQQSKRLLQQLLGNIQQLTFLRMASQENNEQRQRKVEAAKAKFQQRWEENKSLHEDYCGALFSSISRRKKQSLEEIASLNNSSFLKELFAREFFGITSIDDTANQQQVAVNEEKEGIRAEALYQLLLLFTKPYFAKTEKYGFEVLNWLLEEKVQQTVVAKEMLSVVHLMLLRNNAKGTEEAFNWLRKNYQLNELRSLLFESRDQQGKGLLEYLIEGIINVIESSNYPQLSVIKIILREFSVIVDHKQQFVEEKKQLIKEALREKAEFTEEEIKVIEEEFLENPAVELSQ